MTKEEVQGLYNETIQTVLKDYGAFTGFIGVAAQHYKHSSADQLLIFAQNPDAQLVAASDVWESIGGTVKAVAKPMHTLAVVDSLLEVVPQYAESQVNIAADVVQEHLNRWSLKDIEKLGNILNCKSGIMEKIREMAEESYTAKSAEVLAPISQNTCVELATYMIGRKLSIIGAGKCSDQTYMEMSGTGKGLPSALQWVNRVMRETHAQLEKSFEEGAAKHGKQKRRTGYVWQDGSNLSENEGAGRLFDASHGGQLTFADIASATRAGGIGQQRSPKQETLTETGNRGRTERFSESHSDSPADRERGTGASEPAVSHPGGGMGERNQGEEPELLRPALSPAAVTPEPQGYGGSKTKYKNNVLAIKTLHTVERENRPATSAEKTAMKQYTGWGGIPQAFDSNNDKWSKEYTELRELLSEDEYKQARRSTLNAHYTPPEIIREIFHAAQRMGFTGGKVLDPSTGNGRFFSALPKELQAELYGVELDSLTGRLAQHIHPQANINIQGYQDAQYPDSFFDGIFSNIPFGNYSVADSRYKNQHWSIHEYFFGKSLDLLKPGGVMAFITSKYIMDRKDNKVRQYIAQRAELLGAVRLPNTTFREIANTEVTADILFLRKREHEIVPEDGWLHLGLTADGVPVNEYFVDNPQNVLGTMVFEKSMFGKETDTACINEKDYNVKLGLREALAGICEPYPQLPDIKKVAVPRPTPLKPVAMPTPKEKPQSEIPADPNVKNYTYTIVDGHLYYRENGGMYYQEDVTGTKLGRIMGMVAIKTAFLKVIDCQVHGYSESDLTAAQAELNRVYDAFQKEYGFINSGANRSAMKEDVDRPLIQSLETAISKDEYVKADIFSQRTINAPVAPVVRNAADALAVSLNQRGHVDIEYMAEVYKKPTVDIITELGDKLYIDPHTEMYLTADEYLSGNVREKLLVAEEAVEYEPSLRRNVDALRAVQPERLPIGTISFQIGTTWIPEKYKLEFLYDVLRVPNYIKDRLEIEQEFGTTRYMLKGKADGRRNCVVNACNVYGTMRRSAFDIFEDCLNLQMSTVYDIVFDENDNKKRVLNPSETQLARAKQAALQGEFTAWIQQNKEICTELEDIYNTRFNVYVPRKHDGTFLEIPGMSKQISLREHQLNAVARIVFGENALIAHEVGSGKTYTLAAAATLSKSIGLANKPCFVIPNHMIDQWMREFYTIFPSANLLVTTKKDFEKSNRQRFIARIATGEYDAIIMTHRQFESIPMSPEYRKRMIESEIEEITSALSGSGDKNYSVKRMEKQKANLEARLESLADESRKDNVLYFDQLGIDRLYVDEAHYYKNCYIHTKITGVAGLGGTRAEKSFDMLMKARYMGEITKNKGLVFATGTPVTNSLSEMYVMQRYLQHNVLERAGLAHFDEWASTFATIENVLEIAPEGSGFRDRTRFSSFNNLPQLVNMYHMTADVQLVEDLPYIERPGIVGGRPEVITVQPSEYVQKFIGELAERAEAIRNGTVDRSKDNMLLITTQGRAVAIDPRLVDPNARVNRDSKIYAACDKIYNFYKQYDEQRGVQLGFLDTGIQMYEVMKKDLVRQGIPAHEIAFIHDADTDQKKATLFEKCRTGEVRVLFGSTSKMGAGTNIQDRLIALHDIDCPWRPADLEQRHGRILRQGNMFPEAHICQYITKGTFDSYLFQLLEQKQKFISQVMSNKSPARSCSDLDESVLSYSEIKALAAGDIRVREKMELDNEIKRIQLERRSHYAAQDRLEDIIKKTPERIERLEAKAEDIVRDMAAYKEPADFNITIKGTNYDKRTDAAEALEKVFRTLPHQGERTKIGEYAGFKLTASKASPISDVKAWLEGHLSYAIDIGMSGIGNLTKIENTPRRFEGQHSNVLKEIDAQKSELKNAQRSAGEPFAQEGKLQELVERQAVLDFELECELKKDIPAPAHNEPEYEP